MSKYSVSSWKPLAEHYPPKQEASSSRAPFQDVSGSTRECTYSVVTRGGEGFGFCAVLAVGGSCPTSQHLLYSWLPCVNTWNNSGGAVSTLSLHGDDHLLSLPETATSASLLHHRSLEIWAVNLLQFPPSVPLPATYYPPP